MKKLLKRNQLMITALAIMLAIAGYLQFSGTNLEEDQAANSSNLVSEMEGTITEVFTVEDDLFSDLSDIESLDTDSDLYAENYLDTDMTVAEATGEDSGNLAEGESGGEAQNGDVNVAEVQPDEDEVPGEAVFTSSNGIAVISDAKLAKEQVRSKNKETLLQIINSTTIMDTQKQEAIDAMVEMTNIAEKEAAAELLLQAKGFSDVVVSINNNAVDVVVNAISLTDAQRAQIEDIVKRKTEIGAENIIISTVVE